ncbi:hypothetical protein ABT288_15120 [Streptomyces sp. NPDC001093]|uniref:hypothetical protein n=1 Tax=Streptomyces sp. NPDC001093 TaxID=3154376 RepID=UPI0033210B24
MSDSWTYDIQANGGWQETKIRGDGSRYLMVRAAGEWAYRQGKDVYTVDADGQSPKVGQSVEHLRTAGKPQYLHAGQDGVIGSLIGKWGPNGGPFKIGKHFAFSNPDTSNFLYLAMNDNAGDGFKDNSGVMQVVAYLYVSKEREPQWVWEGTPRRWTQVSR